MQLKQKFWILKRKTYDFAHSNEFRRKTKTFKGSVLSIVCGLIAAGLVVAIMNVNPFEYLGSLFAIAFNSLWINQTFQIMAVLGVAALAVAVAFEAGLFNIGVAGQMVLGVMLSTLIANSIYPEMSSMSHLGGGVIFLVFLVCVLSAASIALLSGWLKTQFNIHEVVSTIMLNYIVWYLVKFIFLKWSTRFASSGVASNPFPAGQLTWGTSQIAVPLIILFICVIAVWFIFRKTVFGFKAKAIGYSSSVSQYAGINVKHKILLTMTLSGALAGVASFLNLFTIAPNISFGSDVLPNTGYDAIAIALVAFNNAWGVVAVSFLWAIFQSAGPNAATLYLLPVQTSMLVFGFVVYFAAISVVFMRWHPIRKLRLWYAIIKSPNYRQEVDRLKKEIFALDMWRFHKDKDLQYQGELAIFRNQMANAESLAQRKEIRVAEHAFKRDYQEKIALMRHEYRTQLKNFYHQISQAVEERGINGIRVRNRQKLIQINDRGLEKIEQLKLAYIKTKSQYRDDFRKFASRFRVQKRALAEEYKHDAKILRTQYGREKAKLTLSFELKNETLLLRGQLQKSLTEIKVQTRDARAQARLDAHLVRFDNHLSPLEKRKRLEKIRHDRNQLLAQYRYKQEVLRGETRAKIKRLRERHHQRVLDLRSDPTPLQVLKAEYQNKFNNLKARYDTALQEVNHQIARQSHKINPLQGRRDLKLMDLLYDQCWDQLTYLRHDRNLSLNESTNALTQDLQLIRHTAQELVKVAGVPKFKEYDDTNIARRKTHLLIRIAHLQYLFATEKVMLANEHLWKQNRDINHRIVVKFKEYEQVHNLGNRGLRILNREENSGPPQPPVSPEAVQEFIEKLESQYTKARGV